MLCKYIGILIGKIRGHRHKASGYAPGSFEPILLQILLQVMMSMAAMSNALQVILSKIITFLRPTMYGCTMMM